MADRRTALITGAARGIGAGVARRLVADGYHVLLVDREPKVTEVARDIQDAGGTAHALVHDLTDVASSSGLAETACTIMGRVDALVNSAGVSRPRRHDEVTEDDWDFIVDLNAKGTFFLTAAVVRQMAHQRSGSVVTISSISGKGWREASSVPYAASKAAVIAMTRLLAHELGEQGVRLNTVCPGITRTEMMAHWSETRAEALGMSVEEFVASRVQDSALRRASDVSDVAAMVAFLASDEARNITGQSFNVDGGTMWD